MQYAALSGIGMALHTLVCRISNTALNVVLLCTSTN
jgi:hypothetical protein